MNLFSLTGFLPIIWRRKRKIAILTIAKGSEPFLEVYNSGKMHFINLRYITSVDTVKTVDNNLHLVEVFTTNEYVTRFWADQDSLDKLLDALLNITVKL